jgi:glycosyltransferase involved in cell wall biosynthesis
MTAPTHERPVHLSVCIPAYNRAARLPALLDSVFAQDYDDYEVVICEDRSPEREAIAAVAAAYSARHPGRVRYFENAENLGYDANFRELIRRARGEYCFIMGNDDVVAPGALATVADALARYPDVGVVLRTVAYFRGDAPDDPLPLARYFPEERLFAPGHDTVVTFFRRLVSMSGIVLHRAEALRHETDRFDGTLFYQLHLAGHVLMHKHGLYLPQVLAYMRKDGVPDFGASSRERGRWIPGRQPPETSLRMLQGHLDIAEHAEAVYGGALRARVHRDLGNYMYPAFSHQAHLPAREFVRFYRDLLRMGFWRYPPVHAYAAAILVLGVRRTDAVLNWVRRRLGHTPVIGRSARPVAVGRPADARPAAGRTRSAA